MIGVLDIGIGNIRSVYKAVYAIGQDVELINDLSQVDLCTHLILPGVGHYGAAVDKITNSGFAEKIRSFASSGKPLLGICLGMQLLGDSSEEAPGVKGLGFIEGGVKKFSNSAYRIPHVGWNSVRFESQHPIFDGVKDQRDFYFVHSFYFSCIDSESALAQTPYGLNFTSVVGVNNIVGLQFHPEKSQSNGLRILENFCEWDGVC